MRMGLHVMCPAKKRGCIMGGVTALLSGSLLLWLTPRPLELLRLSGALSHLPPLWLLVCLHLSWYLAVGMIWGCLWGGGCTGRGDAAFWKGSTLLLWSMTVLSLWYILLFGKGLPLAAFLCLPVGLICWGGVVLCWWGRYSAAACGIGVCGLWPLLLFFWHLLCMLSV